MQNSAKKYDLKRELRNALGRFPTGVAIASTLSDGEQPVGITINSLTSISLEPALIAWSIDNRSASYDSFTKAKEFAVTVLAESQANLAMRFATPVVDKFKDLEIDRSSAPVIPGGCAWFKCRTYRTILLGDHTMLVGEIIDFDAGSLSPLVFAGGQFQHLEQNLDALTRTAA